MMAEDESCCHGFLEHCIFLLTQREVVTPLEHVRKGETRPTDRRLAVMTLGTRLLDHSHISTTGQQQSAWRVWSREVVASAEMSDRSGPQRAHRESVVLLLDRYKTGCASLGRERVSVTPELVVNPDSKSPADGVLISEVTHSRSDVGS